MILVSAVTDICIQAHINENTHKHIHTLKLLLFPKMGLCPVKNLVSEIGASYLCKMINIFYYTLL